MNPGGREEIFAKACCGNGPALAFLGQLFRAADVADDLHDRDHPANVAEVLQRLVLLNANPFFRQHADALTSLMLAGVLSWDLSNDLGGHPARQFYADQLEQVLFHVAMLCGGYDHAKEVMREWLA